MEILFPGNISFPIRRFTICGLLMGLLPIAQSNAQPGPSFLAPTLVMKGEISALHVSLDGRYVVFIDWNGGELLVHDRATNTDRQLTHKGPSDAGQYPGNAAISPDNQMVAYNWYRPDGFEVRLMPLSGGEPRHIDTGGVASWLQGWTPDGRELLILKANSLEETGDLGFVDIETGRFRCVSQAQASTHARLSPNGSQIVLSELSKPDPTQNDLYLVECATGKKQLLLGGPDDDYSPDWASDGKNILFISDRGGRPRLWRLRLSPARYDPEPLDDMVDGDLTIVGATQKGQVLVGAEDIGGTDSYSGTVDWAKGRLEDVRVLRSPPYKGSRRPVPSPDGKQIAFLRRGRGYRVRPGWQIPVVYSFDKVHERVYPTALTLRDAPVWYPDGRALLFAMPPEGAVGDSLGREWRFVRLDLETGRFTEVGRTAASGLVRMSGLTERSLFYLLGGNRIMALDWKTGANRELFRWSGDASITDASVLSDGERIALAIWGKPATILAITPPSLEPVRVAQVQTSSRPQLVWCSDRQSILISGTLGGKQGIWRIPANGREPQRLELEQSDIAEVRLSENGERIAFTRRIPRPTELWAYPQKSLRLDQPPRNTRRTLPKP